MSYIKGTYVKNIYDNKETGYIVGVLKIKETDLDIIQSTVYFQCHQTQWSQVDTAFTVF